MFSAWVPAKRAGRVDPVVAMTGQNVSVEKVFVGVSSGERFWLFSGWDFFLGIYTRYSDVSIYWRRFGIYFTSGCHHFPFIGAPDYLAIRNRFIKYSVHGDVIIRGTSNSYMPSDIYQQITQLAGVKDARRIQYEYGFIKRDSGLIQEEDKKEFGKSFSLKSQPGVSMQML